MKDLLIDKKRVNALHRDMKVSKITDGKLNQDATASSKGTTYQFCVAVQKCYEMVAGEKVLIESMGDVTIEESQQIETKFYSDVLTDNHINFWKTLYNWMHNNFDPKPYSSLILYTTQNFGKRAKISKWNESNSQKRLEILQAIHKQAEKRKKCVRKTSSSQLKISDVLSYQRFVLDSSRSSKLLTVIEKFVIDASSPKLPELYSLIKQQHIKGILENKKDDFLYALIGFITQPQANKFQNWEITYDQFDKIVGHLNSQYCRETKEFPTKHCNKYQELDTQEVEEYRNFSFVKKIHEIEYFDAVSEAVQSYISALQTIQNEFKNYEVPTHRTKNYTSELILIFKSNYRIASRCCVNIIADSQNFYDKITVEEPREFEGFNRPPMYFRNGLLHAQLDADNNLQWRLKKL